MHKGETVQGVSGWLKTQVGSVGFWASPTHWYQDFYLKGGAKNVGRIIKIECKLSSGVDVFVASGGKNFGSINQSHVSKGRSDFQQNAVHNLMLLEVAWGFGNMCNGVHSILLMWYDTVMPMLITNIFRRLRRKEKILSGCNLHILFYDLLEIHCGCGSYYLLLVGC